MSRKVTKAIFPVAGFGTRFLPATKSIPKEMLPLVDRPLIQYAIDEARAAGITEFIFVTSRGKSALEDYFDRAPELEAQLHENGKTKLLESLHQTDMGSGAVAYVRQHERLGLGHAVWCARHLIGDEPFAVILPDDVIDAETPCLKQMVEAHASTGGSLVATMEVPREATAAYGILDLGPPSGDTAPVRRMVEKPKPEDAPSNLAIIGRYILDRQVLCHLDDLKRGAGGEIQLTDAIAKEAARTGNVHAFRFRGTRYDCGSKSGFLQATVAFGLQRPELRDEFSEFLSEIMASQDGTRPNGGSERHDLSRNRMQLAR
jgi:UTP--glucose-1-phosphate uridylyltransferase